MEARGLQNGLRLNSWLIEPRALRVLGGGVTHVVSSEHMQVLLIELYRRRVFRVATSYLIGMWILLQVAEVTFAPLRFSGWWITALTILAVMGMPVMIVLSWTYQITSDGVVRDSEDAAEAILFSRVRRAGTPAIILGASLMAVVTGYAWFESIR
jgi:hypothetical protein